MDAVSSARTFRGSVIWIGRSKIRRVSPSSAFGEIREEVKGLVQELLRAEAWQWTTDLPNTVAEHLAVPSSKKLAAPGTSSHPPRILLLYGSLRERSYSRLLTLEAERLLQHFGAETRVYDPRGLPLPDSVPPDHPKVAELRELSNWSEGQVWCSPERHGAITGVFKSQIDWLPLNSGAVRQRRAAPWP